MHRSRYQIYKQFNNFVQKTNRSMDDICRNVKGEFKLQAQQAFLKEYMQNYPYYIIVWILEKHARLSPWRKNI